MSDSTVDRTSDQCCERDDDHDGNCPIHSAPGVFRIAAMNEQRRTVTSKDDLQPLREVLRTIDVLNKLGGLGHEKHGWLDTAGDTLQAWIAAHGNKPHENETLYVGLPEALRREAATVKLGECMPAGRFPEGVSRYNALMWAAELIDERTAKKAETLTVCGICGDTLTDGKHAQKADERRPGNCNRRNIPGDPCDRNCNWPECGCVCGTDGVMQPALSEASTNE